MKKNQRIGGIIKILCENPNKIMKLDYFCKRFNAAKSSISEDVKVCKDIINSQNLGKIETIPGALGGIRYYYDVSEIQKEEIQKELIEMLSDPTRLLGGGFLYTSDIMFNPSLVKKIASIFASKFRDFQADCVVTIETKGIPLAMMTAELLNLPAIVIRRESRISEGPTVSINYFSGSSERIQKMSISKRAAEKYTKALIIDDFMRAGGSLKGVWEMLSEFNIQVVGTGVSISTIEPSKKKIDNFYSLILYDDISSDENNVIIYAAKEE